MTDLSPRGNPTGLKKKPGAKSTKSLIDAGQVSLSQKERVLKNRILTEARSIVLALSQGPEAPTVEELFFAARAFVETLRPHLESVYDPARFSLYNAFVILTTEADLRLFHDPLKTVGCFSAALMAVARYQPVRR